ncbi:MAG: DNA repair protein RecO, partial [Algiphilus sp.]
GVSAERVQDVPAYILQKRPYRETSLLLEALTPEHGRVGLIARGARGQSKRRSGSVDLLQRYRMQWHRRGELGTLQAIEAEGNPYALVGERVLWVWYANELLLRALARDDPHAPIFDAYEALLAGLVQAPLAGAQAGGGDAAAEPLLRRFEWSLLCALGYQPQGAVPTAHADQGYAYDTGQGAYAAAGGRLSAAGLRDALRGSFDTPAACAAGRAVFRAHLPELIGPQPLRTPAMLRRLRANRTESS